MTRHELARIAREYTEKYISLGNRLFAAKLQKPLAMPQIDFTLRGSTAGTASYDKFRLNFHPVLMAENIEDYKSDTIPHEVAHLFTRAMYGRAAQSHGPEWKAVMRAFGVEPTRCHSMDMSTVRAKSHPYKATCGCPDKVYNLKPKQAIQTQRGHLSCRRCKSLLVLVPGQNLTMPAGVPSGLPGTPSISIPRPRTPAWREPTLQPAKLCCAICQKELSAAVVSYCRSKSVLFKGKLLCFEHQKTAAGAAAPAPTPTAPAIPAITSAAPACCAKCGKAVSEKVAAYCRSNAAFMNNQILCYEHQRGS